MLFEWASLFCCFFLLASIPEVAFWDPSEADLVLVNSWAASSCRSFNEDSFELIKHFFYEETILVWAINLIKENITCFLFFYRYNRLFLLTTMQECCLEQNANLANCWSNFFTRASHDPGFMCSICSSELIISCTVDPSRSSAKACTVNAQKNKLKVTIY